MVVGLGAASPVHAAGSPGLMDESVLPNIPASQSGILMIRSLPSGNSEEFRRHMQGWIGAEESPVERTIERETEAVRVPLAISSPFGLRSDPIKGIRRRHEGIDLPAYSGARVYATGAGVVSIAGWVSGYGNLVEIAHPGGVRTRYGHLSRILVSPGFAVAQGQVIGAIGSTGRSTGPHLHYEVRVHGIPANPMQFIGRTIPTYQTAWLPEAPTVSRTGWRNGDDANSLPQVTIH